MYHMADDVSRGTPNHVPCATRRDVPRGTLNHVPCGTPKYLAMWHIKPRAMCTRNMCHVAHETTCHVVQEAREM